jgi:hypothetical protein
MQQNPVDHRPGSPPPEGIAAGRLLKRVCNWGLSVRYRLAVRMPERRDDRGDVPGWVLVTLMTAGLVVTLWAVAGPRLEEVFNDAMDRVVGGP